MSSLRLVFLFSSEEPGSRDPMAVEPSISPGRGQDLAGDPETLEAEATHVSTLHIRAVRALKLRSISVDATILAEKVLTIRRHW